MAIESLQFSDHTDVCDVCRVKIPDLTTSITSEFDGILVSFCSENCRSRYIEDPAFYADLDDDVDLH